MDEMLKEFLAELAEQIEAASAQIVEFERNPHDAALIASIFRLVHTIKGTCGFLGLNRLQMLTHAAESLIGALREGAKATPEVVSAILAAVDRVKLMLAELEDAGQEVEGDDTDLIKMLEQHVARCNGAAMTRLILRPRRESWLQVEPKPAAEPAIMCRAKQALDALVAQAKAELAAARSAAPASAAQGPRRASPCRDARSCHASAPRRRANRAAAEKRRRASAPKPSASI